MANERAGLPLCFEDKITVIGNVFIIMKVHFFTKLGVRNILIL